MKNHHTASTLSGRQISDRKFTLIELLVRKTCQICVYMWYFFKKSTPLFLKGERVRGVRGEREASFPAYSFTLIELLVVIAIIAILAAILMPALSRSREVSKQMSCVNNMKQFGFYWQNYSEDYDGFIMPTRFQGTYKFYHKDTGKHLITRNELLWDEYTVWSRKFGAWDMGKGLASAYPNDTGYTTKILQCPASPGVSRYQFIPMKVDYAYNYHFAHTPVSVYTFNKRPSFITKLERVQKYTSKIMVLTDDWNEYAKFKTIGSTRTSNHCVKAFKSEWFNNIGAYAAHPAGATQLFADGHAEVLQYYYTANNTQYEHSFAVWDGWDGSYHLAF